MYTPRHEEKPLKGEGLFYHFWILIKGLFNIISDFWDFVLRHPDIYMNWVQSMSNIVFEQSPEIVFQTRITTSQNQ